MRIITGNLVRELAAADMSAWSGRHPETTLDLGTGDGRFVRHLAQKHPNRGAIGVDLCAANLRTASRRPPSNAMFVVADALALPEELTGAATAVTITCPWGSLLRGLLTGHAGLLAGLNLIRRGRTPLQITLNAGALAEAGWALDVGSERVAATLRDAGIDVLATRRLGPADLRTMPATWAKRLAFGRDPRAVRLDASLA